MKGGGLDGMSLSRENLKNFVGCIWRCQDNCWEGVLSNRSLDKMVIKIVESSNVILFLEANPAELAEPDEAAI